MPRRPHCSKERAATASTTSRFPWRGGGLPRGGPTSPASEGICFMQRNNPMGMPPPDDQPNGIVGKPLDRVDGRLKVTGGAVYAYEVEQGPQAAYGYVVQASIGKGRIRSIASRVAEQMPGVVLVLTHLNAPEQG